jgi:hypothetical protein
MGRIREVRVSRKGHLYHLNSLEFPDGHLDGVKLAQRHIALGSMDVVMTNPPFGSEIPITDENILKNYELAHLWEKTEDGNFRNTGRLQGSVAPARHRMPASESTREATATRQRSEVRSEVRVGG